MAYCLHSIFIFIIRMKLKKDGFDIQLRIVGTGELEASLKSQCEQLEIIDNCEFTGFVKPAYPYMKASDIFLSTSEAEGYPLVLCEALCLGLPIVATNITGASEILDNSKYGLLVGEDVDAIYQGVKELLKNDDLREHYAHMAKERAMSFSVEKIVGEIEQIL